MKPIPKSVIVPNADKESPVKEITVPLSVFLVEATACKLKVAEAKRAESRWKQLQPVMQQVIQELGEERVTKTGSASVVFEAKELGQAFVLSVQQREVLDPKLLLKAGVTPEQLKAGKRSVPTPQVRMRACGSDVDEAADDEAADDEA